MGAQARRALWILGAAALAAGLSAAPARAWWPEGHSVIAEAGIRTLPAEVPAFFREGAGLIAHCAQDPDVVKSRSTPNLRDAEEPEHYIDWELLKGRPLPATRYTYLKLCGDLGVKPNDVGTLPYSVTEWTERLTIGFAEHRRYPDNPHIRTKCLVYAGILAHYAGDLSMPLHCTVHYNGRARPDGTSPRTGIHARVDSLIEKCGLKPQDLAQDQKPQPVEAILPAVLAEIGRSRALVDRTYELEAGLPPEEGEWTPAPQVLAFARERGRAGAGFLGSLYLTAWKKSETVSLPAWLKREPAPGARR